MCAGFVLCGGERDNHDFPSVFIWHIPRVGHVPLLYWLNQDWYDVLMHTPLGRALLAVIAAVMFISTAAVIKLTRPIEYRR